MSYNQKEYQATYLTGGTSAQVFSGKGTLHAIVVGTTTATAVTIYDSVGATSGTIGLLKSSIVEGTYTFNAAVANGLYITLGAAGTYTVLWTK